ncbi:MAG: hypothetical protein C0498_13380 [Anaerolinea sp.]|nr:hypothetical protein [Anaerolinea sp.]
MHRSPVLAVGIVIGLVFGAAGLIGDDPPWRVALSTAIPIAYALLVTLVGRRSETVSVLAGRPVDERWELINLEASAWALGVTAIVVLAAVIVADATGGDWLPYAFMGAVMAVAYAGSLAVLRLRQ